MKFEDIKQDEWVYIKDAKPVLRVRVESKRDYEDSTNPGVVVMDESGQIGQVWSRVLTRTKPEPQTTNTGTPSE